MSSRSLHVKGPSPHHVGTSFLLVVGAYAVGLSWIGGIGMLLERPGVRVMAAPILVVLAVATLALIACSTGRPILAAAHWPRRHGVHRRRPAPRAGARAGLSPGAVLVAVYSAALCWLGLITMPALSGFGVRGAQGTALLSVIPLSATIVAVAVTAGWLRRRSRRAFIDA